VNDNREKKATGQNVGNRQKQASYAGCQNADGTLVQMAQREYHDRDQQGFIEWDVEASHPERNETAKEQLFAKACRHAKIAHHSSSTRLRGKRTEKSHSATGDFNLKTKGAASRTRTAAAT
jgi:hypothetical protein